MKKIAVIVTFSYLIVVAASMPMKSKVAVLPDKAIH